jgi:hypothetical protein
MKRRNLQAHATFFCAVLPAPNTPSVSSAATAALRRLPATSNQISPTRIANSSSTSRSSLSFGLLCVYHTNFY